MAQTTLPQDMKIHADTTVKAIPRTFASSTVSERFGTSRKHVTSELSISDGETRPHRIEAKKEPPLDRIYPHLFDESTNAGNVMTLFQHALSDAQLAIEAYGEPDIQTVSTRLTNIAAMMSTAYALIDFNKSLAATVSFLRRATLATPLEAISRPSLNTIAFALQSILNNPMITLDESSDLVEKLERDGWKGGLQVVDALIAELMKDVEDDEVQAELFPHPPLKAG